MLGTRPLDSISIHGLTLARQQRSRAYANHAPQATKKKYVSKLAASPLALLQKEGFNESNCYSEDRQNIETYPSIHQVWTLHGTRTIDDFRSCVQQTPITNNLSPTPLVIVKDGTSSATHNSTVDGIPATTPTSIVNRRRIRKVQNRNKVLTEDLPATPKAVAIQKIEAIPLTCYQPPLGA